MVTRVHGELGAELDVLDVRSTFVDPPIGIFDLDIEVRVRDADSHEEAVAKVERRLNQRLPAGLVSELHGLMEQFPWAEDQILALLEEYGE